MQMAERHPGARKSVLRAFGLSCLELLVLGFVLLHDAAWAQTYTSASVAFAWSVSVSPSATRCGPIAASTGAWSRVVAGSKGIQNTVACFSTVGVVV